MSSLKSFQNTGIIENSYQTVSLKGINLIPVNLMESRKLGFKDVVAVTGKIVWAATRKGTNPLKAEDVITYNGNTFGKWEKRTSTFFELVVTDDKLTVIKKYNFNVEKKENNIMELNGLNEDLLGNTDLLQELNTFTPEKGAAPKKESKEPKVHEETIEEKNTKKITEKVKGITIANREDMVLENQVKGRLLFFVTKTNEVLKASKRKVKKTDEATGDPILLPTAPQAARERHAEKKRVEDQWYEKEFIIGFSHAKPSSILGAVIKTPTATDLSITKFRNPDKAMMAQDNETGYSLKFLALEPAQAYISTHYGDRIQEAEEVLGDKATTIIQKHKTVTTDTSGNTAEAELKIRNVLAVEKKNSRTSVLVDGNYFPIKVYKTVPQGSITEKDLSAVNLNLEAVLKKEKAYEELNAESKQYVRKTKDGYESDYFKAGAGARGIVVKRFDNKAEELTDVRVPLREKKPTKTGGFSYPYLFGELEDLQNGPLSVKKYQALVKMTDMSNEDFIKNVETLKKSTSRKGGSKKAVTEISNEDFVKSLFADAGINNGINMEPGELQRQFGIKA